MPLSEIQLWLIKTLHLCSCCHVNPPYVLWLTSSVLRWPVGNPATSESAGREEGGGSVWQQRHAQLFLWQCFTWEIQRSGKVKGQHLTFILWFIWDWLELLQIINCWLSLVGGCVNQLLRGAQMQSQHASFDWATFTAIIYKLIPPFHVHFYSEVTAITL